MYITTIHLFFFIKCTNVTLQQRCEVSPTIAIVKFLVWATLFWLPWLVGGTVIYFYKLIMLLLFFTSLSFSLLWCKQSHTCKIPNYFTYIRGIKLNERWMKTTCYKLAQSHLALLELNQFSPLLKHTTNGSLVNYQYSLIYLG